MAMQEQIEKAWQQQFADTSAPAPQEFEPLDIAAVEETIAELREQLDEELRAPSPSSITIEACGEDLDLAETALRDLRTGHSVYRAQDDDGYWYLRVGDVDDRRATQCMPRCGSGKDRCRRG
jgi:hypothetical protein